MSLIDNAKRELDLIDFGREDTAAMIDILERFFEQWDSGGAVWVVAPILMRCIAGKPLSPLTGADDEWFDHGMTHGVHVLQNMRCSTVFKQYREDVGRVIAYDIDTEGRPEITFPHWPGEAEVSSPVIEI